jgi:drug/metabolite transporter (DMT)-like permease
MVAQTMPVPPRPLFAALLALLAVLAGSGMDVFGKGAMVGTGSWQGVALRWGFGLALLLPLFLLRRRRPSMVDRRVHFLRMVLNLLGTWCYFEALARLPLSLVVTVFYAEPLLALPMVRLLLRERLTWPRLVALAIGFGGVLLAARPQSSGDLAGVALALLGAFAWAALFVLTKRYGRREPVLDLMFWLALSTSLVALPLALADWRPLASSNWWGFLAVAFCGLLNGLCWLSALKTLDALVLTALGYLGLPIGFAAALVLFDEAPPLATWAGAVLVLLAVAVLGYGERRHRLRLMLDAGPVPHP